MNDSNRENINLRFISKPVSDQGWISLMPGFEVKTLFADKGRHAVQFLMRATADWNPGIHRHVCETSLLVIEGGINNRWTRRSYKPLDFFYQEAGNTHVENMSDEGLLAYVSMVGTSDTLVEFLDKEKNVLGTLGVSDFAGLLSDCS